MRYRLNGKDVTREEFEDAGSRSDDWLQARGRIPNTYREHDPLLSDGIGCMKKQVPELREVIRKHDIKGVRVQDDGRLQITSRQGRKELLRVRGLADADGGFGD